MSKKICIAETKKDLDVIYQSRKNTENLICLPLNLETYLYCLDKKINFIDPFNLVNNDFHKKTLVEGEKFVNSLILEKNISETINLEIKSTLRVRFYSVVFLFELINKILKKYKSISIIIISNSSKTHKLNSFLVEDIVSNLFSNIPIEKNKAGIKPVSNDCKNYLYSIDLTINKNKKNILINTLGYNFKRLIFSKLFDFGYKFYSFDTNKVSFLKKILLKILKVEIIKIKRTANNSNNNSIIKEINYKFSDEKIRQTILILIEKLQSYFSNFYNKKKAIDLFLKDNSFSLILTNMLRGEGGFITENKMVSCPSVCISHGTVAEKFNEYDEIYKKIIASSVFGGNSEYLAIQSKIAEKSLNTHKFDKKKLITGNFLFSEKHKGFFSQKKSILFAVTLKKFYNLQFLGVEMFYEFIRNLDLLNKFSSEKKIKIIVKIHPSEANCIHSLRKNFSNLIFTNEPVEKIFAKVFVTISFSSSVIEDSLNSKVPVILMDQWKRYVHCKFSNDEKSPICYVDNYDSLSQAIKKILKVKKFNFDEFIYGSLSKDNLKNKVFTLIN